MFLYANLQGDLYSLGQREIELTGILSGRGYRRTGEELLFTFGHFVSDLCGVAAFGLKVSNDIVVTLLVAILAQLEDVFECFDFYLESN